jgi:3'(2'), 5'-bisphosphate nucleotidase
MHTATIVTKDILPRLSGVQQLARKAGEAIMAVYKTNSRGRLFDKSDQSPVTLADQQAHQCLISGLSCLFPGYSIISEEDVVSCARPLVKPFWLIDPLDGTKEFLNGDKEFTVNLALVYEGFPVWGLVYAPALELMYWGGLGHGAHCQKSEEITSLPRVSDCRFSGSYRITASKNHLNDETKAWIEQWGQTELVQAGSSLKFCRIADGTADLYPRLGPTCEWDTAAAQAVLEGAGGHVFDLHGRRLSYGKEDVLNPSFIASRWSWEQYYKIFNSKV